MADRAAGLKAREAEAEKEKEKRQEAPRSWWWCRHCHGYVDLLEPGDPFPQCEVCRGRVHLQEPAGETANSKLQTSGKQPAPNSKRGPLPEFEWPEGAKPLARTKRKGKLSRLPAEKRDLKVLARTGYWFCYECQEITERTEQEECVLCGSGLEPKFNWNEGVFKEAEADQQKEKPNRKAA